MKDEKLSPFVYIPDDIFHRIATLRMDENITLILKNLAPEVADSFHIDMLLSYLYYKAQVDLINSSSSSS